MSLYTSHHYVMVILLASTCVYPCTRFDSIVRGSTMKHSCRIDVFHTEGRDNLLIVDLDGNVRVWLTEALCNGLQTHRASS